MPALMVDNSNGQAALREDFTSQNVYAAGGGYGSAGGDMSIVAGALLVGIA